MRDRIKHLDETKENEIPMTDTEDPVKAKIVNRLLENLGVSCSSQRQASGDDARVRPKEGALIQMKARK